MNEATRLPHVLHIVRSAGTGGVETHVRLMCELYRNIGGHCSVVSLTSDTPDPAFVAAASDFVQLNDQSTWNLRSLLTVRDLWRHLRKSPAEIVHVHGARPIFAGAIAARLAGKRRIVASLHGSTDLMAVREDGSATRMGLLFARLVHGIGFALAGRTVICAERLGGDVRRCLRLLGPFGRRGLKRVRVVYHGVEVGFVRSPKAISPDRLTVGTLSRLDEPKKGIAYLLRAVKRLQDSGTVVALRVAGNGYSRADLEQLATTLGLVDCQFLGYVRDSREFYSAVDVFVLASLSEGMPLVNLEAMANGVPVVTTDVGGAAEAILADQTGLVVPPADVEALAGAIGRLDKDRDLAQRLAAAGQQRVLQHFTVSATFARLQSVYSEVAT